LLGKTGFSGKIRQEEYHACLITVSLGRRFDALDYPFTYPR
jgi:hypothetical protein